MPHHADKISPEDIREAIVRSGYLLEQRIKPKIERRGYFVETNQPYPDPQTGISREYDISAISAIRLSSKGIDFLFPYILCECENNALPLVFFETNSPIRFMFHEHVKCSGVPVKMWKNGSWVRLSEYLGFEKFHHYCRGRIASQYCSFTQKNNRWIATHLDAQHQTFTNLINALEASIEDHYANTWLPRRGEKEPINIQFYYPLVVIQGDLYLARERREGLVMQKAKHVQFRREIWSTDRRDTYQIDVVQESFMGAYLKMIDKELESIKQRFVRRRLDVRNSIDKLIAQARQETRKRTPFRQIYEPPSRF
jgi:hypothetical protein